MSPETRATLRAIAEGADKMRARFSRTTNDERAIFASRLAALLHGMLEADVVDWCGHLTPHPDCPQCEPDVATACAQTRRKYWLDPRVLLGNYYRAWDCAVGYLRPDAICVQEVNSNDYTQAQAEAAIEALRKMRNDTHRYNWATLNDAAAALETINGMTGK